jgi:hypothetical protein
MLPVHTVIRAARQVNDSYMFQSTELRSENQGFVAHGTVYKLVLFTLWEHTERVCGFRAKRSKFSRAMAVVVTETFQITGTWRRSVTSFNLYMSHFFCVFWEKRTEVLPTLTLAAFLLSTDFPKVLGRWNAKILVSQGLPSVPTLLAD